MVLTFQLSEDFSEYLRLVSVGVQSQQSVLVGHYQLLELLHLTTHMLHKLLTKVLDPIRTDNLRQGLQLWKEGAGGEGREIQELGDRY